MNNLRRALLGAGLCMMASLCQAAVTVEQSTVTLPTYPPGPCDKNPVFMHQHTSYGKFPARKCLPGFFQSHVHKIFMIIFF